MAGVLTLRQVTNADDGSAPPIAAPLGAVTTARLRLRAFCEEDLDELTPVFAKEEVWRFPHGRGFTRDETAAFLDRQVAHWEQRGFGLWAATDRVTGRMLGFVGLSVPMFLPEVLPAVEVGWRLDPDVWGRGLATEAATAAIDEAFATLQLTDVCCIPSGTTLHLCAWPSALLSASDARSWCPRTNAAVTWRPCCTARRPRSGASGGRTGAERAPAGAPYYAAPDTLVRRLLTGRPLHGVAVSGLS